MEMTILRIQVQCSDTLSSVHSINLSNVPAHSDRLTFSSFPASMKGIEARISRSSMMARVDAPEKSGVLALCARRLGRFVWSPAHLELMEGQEFVT